MESFNIDERVIIKFIKKMKTTSYARYDAHKRCERLNNSSLFALTSASLLLIFLGIINQYSSSQCPFTTKGYIDIFSSFTSVLILALSLIVSFASYSLKSERYFRSGNDISELYEQLEIADNKDTHTIRRIIYKYNQIKKNSDNHQSHNYKKGRLERKVENDDVLDESDKLSSVDYISYWSPIAAFYFLSLLSICTFFYVIWNFVQYA
jgi:hypothetical protein